MGESAEQLKGHLGQGGGTAGSAVPKLPGLHPVRGKAAPPMHPAWEAVLYGEEGPRGPHGGR